MKNICATLSFVILVAVAAVGQQSALVSGGEKLTNQDIIGMVSLGLSDDVVIGKIHASQNTDFDTTLDGFKALKAAKVSDAVIKEMLQPKTVAAAVLLPTPAKPQRIGAISDMPDRMGVYYKAPTGNWTALEILMPFGNIAGSFDYGYRGAEAPIRISERKPVFFVQDHGTRTQIWKIFLLDKKKDYRQLWSGLFSGGKNAKHVRDVVVTKISDQVFSVTPAADLVDGEYVLNMGGVGETFDFGIGK